MLPPPDAHLGHHHALRGGKSWQSSVSSSSSLVALLQLPQALGCCNVVATFASAFVGGRPVPFTWPYYRGQRRHCIALLCSGGLCRPLYSVFGCWSLDSTALTLHNLQTLHLLTLNLITPSLLKLHGTTLNLLKLNLLKPHLLTPNLLSAKTTTTTCANSTFAKTKFAKARCAEAKFVESLS